jgi:hypothetical protein
MASRRYVAPRVPDEAELARALADDDAPALSAMVIGSTAAGDDPDRAGDLVRRLLTHPDENVRGNAVLGVGHLARRFGAVEPDLLPHVRAATADPSGYVRGHAESAADDVLTYLRIDVRAAPPAG